MLHFRVECTIRKVDTTEIITTVAGTVTGGFSGDGNLATSARLNGPRGPSFDSAGNLYISDALNHRVRRLNVATQTDFIMYPPGPDITAVVQLPTGRNTNDVDLNGFKLQAINPADGSILFDGSTLRQIDGTNAQVVDAQRLTVKFPRASVTTWVGSDPNILLRVEGKFNNGRYFSDDVTVQNDVITSLNLDPDTLNIKNSTGQWITAYTQFPAGSDASQVNLSTVKIEAINPMDGSIIAGHVADRTADSSSAVDTVNNQLMVKFDRATVATWADGTSELVLRVEGQFNNGSYFSGQTQIKTIYPKH